MQIEIVIDNQSVFKAHVEVGHIASALFASLGSASGRTFQSTPITPKMAKQLLSRVDEKSAVFLKEISHKGSLTWPEMEKIFNIDEWNDYSKRYGKGITRAVRNLTDDPSARLVWWNEEDWQDDDWDEARVYVDGPALDALRSAAQV